MTTGVFLAVLGAAFLHALWNALIKSGSSRVGAMVILSVWEIVLGLVMSAPHGVPELRIVPWLLGAGTFHLIYKTCLTFAYEHGDLSRVYPLARGTAPMAVLIIGALFLGEEVEALEASGIVVLGLGILGLASGVFRSGESKTLIPYALGAAFGTAGYTLLDGFGARAGGDPAAYVAWLFVLDGITYLVLMGLRRGRGVFPPLGKAWAVGAAGGAASYGAYAIAIWAMTLAPIPLVAALRETSILFAVLIGAVVFRERMTMGKWGSVGLIVGGVILTRI